MALEWLVSLGALFKGSSAKHTEVVIAGFEKLLHRQEQREKELRQQVDQLLINQDRLLKLEEKCLEEHVINRQEIRDLKEQLIFIRSMKKPGQE